MRIALISKNWKLHLRNSFFGRSRRDEKKAWWKDRKKVEINKQQNSIFFLNVIKKASFSTSFVSSWLLKQISVRFDFELSSSSSSSFILFVSLNQLISVEWVKLVVKNDRISNFGYNFGFIERVSERQECLWTFLRSCGKNWKDILYPFLAFLRFRQKIRFIKFYICIKFFFILLC